MPTLETATVYPGACLFEGTNLSEGRGTTRPFEIMGAPWIDGDKLVRELANEDLPGVIFRPLSFEPTLQKFQGVVCGGIQQHIVDRESYRRCAPATPSSPGREALARRVLLAAAPTSTS
jgi:uncharacterized protein YbbC (DUF1343 family)